MLKRLRKSKANDGSATTNKCDGDVAKSTSQAKARRQKVQDTDDGGQHFSRCIARRERDSENAYWNRTKRETHLSRAYTSIIRDPFRRHLTMTTAQNQDPSDIFNAFKHLRSHICTIGFASALEHSSRSFTLLAGVMQIFLLGQTRQLQRRELVERLSDCVDMLRSSKDLLMSGFRDLGSTHLEAVIWLTEVIMQRFDARFKPWRVHSASLVNAEAMFEQRLKRIWDMAMLVEKRNNLGSFVRKRSVGGASTGGMVVHKRPSIDRWEG